MSNIALMLNFLNREHYQSYHTPIAKIFKSIEAAILLAEFIQRHQYHSIKGELIEIAGHGGGWFYHTQKVIEERTAIGDRQFRNAMKLLMQHKILDTVSCGIPYTKYYRLNFCGLEELSKKVSSSYTVYEQTSTQCTNRHEHSVRTDSLYIEEPNKEPKEEEDISQSPKSAAPLCATHEISFSFPDRDFQNITTKDFEDWKEIYPAVDLKTELKEMIQWILSNPSKVKGRKLWRKFITTWLQKENEKLTNRQAYQAAKKTNVLERHTGFQNDHRPRDPRKVFVAGWGNPIPEDMKNPHYQNNTP